MGVQAKEPLTLTYDEVVETLRAKTRIFMEVDGQTYYLTHTDGYWRAQDCAKLNDKGHFTDCSELVPTATELVELNWLDGKSVHDVFEDAVFYDSIEG